LDFKKNEKVPENNYNTAGHKGAEDTKTETVNLTTSADMKDVNTSPPKAMVEADGEDVDMLKAEARDKMDDNAMDKTLDSKMNKTGATSRMGFYSGVSSDLDVFHTSESGAR
jgi:hypothetical protein